MRILVWMQTYYPVIGGVQTAARHLFPALRERGHEVAVVASHFSIPLPDVMMVDNIPIHRFNFYNTLANRNVADILREGQRVTKFVREFAPDVVHINGFGPSALFLLRVRQSYNVPFIFTVHGEESSYFGAGDTTLLTQLLTEAKWVTTVTQLEAERFAALMPAVAPKISCVYQGLAEPKEPPSPPPAAPRLLCIGRMEEVKNFALAIRAFARVARAFADARLVFGGDGVERLMLEQLADELGITDQVDFLGWVQPEQIPTHINQASAVVLSSRSEGVPIVGVEAAQMARPLIATRVNGTPELVIDGETGLLTPSEDVEAMAAAMQMLLSDSARAAQMGQAAHERIYRKFSLTGMIDNVYALYERVVSEHTVQQAIGG